MRVRLSIRLTSLRTLRINVFPPNVNLVAEYRFALLLLSFIPKFTFIILPLF